MKTCLICSPVLYVYIEWGCIRKEFRVNLYGLNPLFQLSAFEVSGSSLNRLHCFFPFWIQIRKMTTDLKATVRFFSGNVLWIEYHMSCRFASTSDPSAPIDLAWHLLRFYSQTILFFFLGLIIVIELVPLDAWGSLTCQLHFWCTK